MTNPWIINPGKDQDFPDSSLNLDSVVRVRFRGGDDDDDDPSEEQGLVGAWYWKHTGCPTDIVEYQIVSTTADEDKWIVISGNPVDGMSFHGPFDDGNYANDWARAEMGNAEDWWITRLSKPIQED